MGRIQTSIGLITGMDIVGTVDKLMALAAKPRDLLKTNTESVRQEQVAVTTLSALLLSVRFMTDNLGKAEVYQKRDVASSDPTSLAAVSSGTPALGTYAFTPVRKAANQQWLSSSLLSNTDPLGAGRLTLRFGSDVEPDVRLENFGGGAGLVRGKIRITDRSGASAEIDLSTALTLDDVTRAISDNASINVTAVVRDGRIRLIDDTGQTASNLKVQEVNSRTAASLGLAGIDVAAASADGQSMLRLFAGMALDDLNDRRGVRIDTIMPDIEYELRDGTTGTIDLSPILPNSSQVDRDTTLGDVIERINAQQPDKLRVEIDADGRRLKVVDLTQGDGTFRLGAINGSKALADLGLDAGPAGGELVGKRILGGAGTVLLSSLGGGNGLSPLGQLQLTDRAGQATSVDLSSAETLEDVVEAINAAGASIKASINAARNGLTLTDASGSTQGNLVVASGDGNQTAEKLGLAVNAAVASVSSGDLRLQFVSENTRLASLNGGAGVARGTLTIHDSLGGRAILSLDDSMQTMGDVVRAINRLGLALRAEIGPNGDGLRLVDTGGGATEMKIVEGAGTTARDLGLLQSQTTAEIDGETRKVIAGSLTRTIELSATDTLEDLRKKINDLGMGVTATLLTDGSSRPYRLVLSSDRSGRAGELVIDSTIAGLTFNETVPGQDALLLYGDAGSAASGMLVSSAANKFKGIVQGVDLEIKQATGKTVTVNVSTSPTGVVASVKTMVENYNKFRDKLLELTKYDATSNKRSILSGDATALRLDTDLARLLTVRLSGAGSIRTLAELGVTIDDQGRLEFDESKLRQVYADSPEAVQKFFATAEHGFSARFKKLVDQLAGDDTSLISRRLDALDRKIQNNEQRLTTMQKLLDNQRERMLLQFYRMEMAIGKMKNNLTSIESIKPLTIQTNNQR